ncbi:putative deoxyribonuclease RhsC [compost metagenome]
MAWQWLLTGFGEVSPTTGAKGYVQADSPVAGSLPSYAPEVTFNLRYPGQQWDEETQLSYNVNRYYGPLDGRYFQADPIGLAGGWNRFAYVGGNPIGHTDSFGLADDTLPLVLAPTIPALTGACLANPLACGVAGGLVVGALIYPVIEPTITGVVDGLFSRPPPVYTPPIIVEMAKGGKQNIANEYVREVQAQGKDCDPCSYLRNKMQNETDIQKKLKIKSAMKYYNCDGKDRFQ